MNTSTCQYCNTIFSVKPGSYGKFCSLSCGTAFRNAALAKTNHEKYQRSPKICKSCNLIIPYEKRNNKFCSSSCAAKISNLIVRKRGKTAQEKFPYSKIKFILCDHTKQFYCNKNSFGFTRQCSPYVKTDKEQYYSSARFKFNVYHYPEEFDLSLVSVHGWYSCPGTKRKGQPKNINGVSRDHIMSVSYGFENKIDPAIISHPANCRIMLHRENKTKHGNCAITLPELKDKIKNWDRKYTERRVGFEPTTICLEGRNSTN